MLSRFYLCLRVFVAVGVMLVTCHTVAAELPVFTVSTLKYGTANWELQLIKALKLDKRHGFELEVNEVNSPNAAAVALQAGVADASVQDWLWVIRQRKQGRAFKFAPYSTAVGRLMVPPSSELTEISQLREEQIGVAGGDSDKSWRLLQVLFERKGINGERLNPRFGAPPLLNTLALRGDLDATLTYWHYAARLEASGFRSLITLDEILEALGVPTPVAMLGWTLSADTVAQRSSVVRAFLRASSDAKETLRSDPDAWQAIRPWMRADSEDEFRALKAGFIAGIPPGDGSSTAHIAAVAALYLGVDVSDVALAPEMLIAPESGGVAD